MENTKKDKGKKQQQKVFVLFSYLRKNYFLQNKAEVMINVFSQKVRLIEL